MIVTVLGLVSAFVCSLVSYMPLARIRFEAYAKRLAFIGGKRDIRILRPGCCRGVPSLSSPEGAPVPHCHSPTAHSRGSSAQHLNSHRCSLSLDLRGHMGVWERKAKAGAIGGATGVMVGGAAAALQMRGRHAGPAALFLACVIGFGAAFRQT